MSIVRHWALALALFGAAGPQSRTQEQDSVRERAQALTDRAAAAAKRPDGAVEALELYRDALNLWRAAAERQREGQTLLAIGRLEAGRGDKASARETFLGAAELFHDLDDVGGEGDARYGAARQQFDLYDTTAAIASYERAIVLRRTTGDRFGLALALHNLAASWFEAGDSARAMAGYREALDVCRSIDDRPGVGYTLYGIATIHWARGDLEQAIDTYRDALDGWRTLGDKSGEANTLNSMGLAFEALGDHRRAAVSYRQALERWRATKNLGGEAYTLNNMAMAAVTAGRLTPAMNAYQKALTLLRGVRDLRGQAYVLHNLGDLQAQRGHRQTAMRLYQESLALKQRLGDRFGQAYTLQKLGEVLLAGGDPRGALDRVEQALSLHRAVGDRPGEAAALAAAARAQSALRRLGDAGASMLEAVRLVERLRIDVSNDDLRASYFSTKQDYYEYQIGLLMRSHREDPQAGFDRQALEASERTRSRVLLDRLAIEAAGDQTAGSPSARRRELAQRIKEETARARQAALTGRPAQPSRLEALLAESDQLNAPSAAASRAEVITAPQPLNVDEIQRDLLDGDTVLLEYSLGKEASYGWLVGRHSLTSARLPPRPVVERAARRFYAALTARSTTTDTSLDARAIRLQQADADLQSAAQALARIVLAPFEAQLRATRLIVVADGFLQAVPFAPLPLSSGAPLVSRYEIVHLGSASLLAALRSSSPLAPAPAAPSVAVLADPVFTCDDGRIVVARGTPCSTRSTYPRLRYSRVEAESIAAVAARSVVATDFDATRAALDRPDVRRADILHFATHAVVDAANPAKAGIVLSLIDRGGRTEDGFLRLAGISSLDINASTVVLSACRTALGVPLEGEGLIGLTRSFFLAGSKRVVASFWEVRDRATAALMEEFYRGIYQRKLSPAAALRAAQRRLLTGPQWNHPYYWAGFMMAGDWR